MKRVNKMATEIEPPSDTLILIPIFIYQLGGGIAFGLWQKSFNAGLFVWCLLGLAIQLIAMLCVSIEKGVNNG